MLDGHRLRGHTFHYSTLETALAPLVQARTPDGRAGERLFRCGSLTASYMHLYFVSAPVLIAALFGRSAQAGT